MGFDEFLGNQRVVSALRGMLRRERVPSALLFTGPARHRQIHAGAHVRAGGELRAAQGRFLRRVRLVPADRASRRSGAADRSGPRRTRRIRRHSGGRAHAADSRNASRRLADRSGPGAAAQSRGPADDSRGAIARGAARGVFQAAGAAARCSSWMARIRCAGTTRTSSSRFSRSRPNRRR